MIKRFNEFVNEGIETTTLNTELLKKICKMFGDNKSEFYEFTPREKCGVITVCPSFYDDEEGYELTYGFGDDNEYSYTNDVDRLSDMEMTYGFGFQPDYDGSDFFKYIIKKFGLDEDGDIDSYISDLFKDDFEDEFQSDWYEKYSPDMGETDCDFIFCLKPELTMQILSMAKDSSDAEAKRIAKIIFDKIQEMFEDFCKQFEKFISDHLDEIMEEEEKWIGR